MNLDEYKNQYNNSNSSQERLELSNRALESAKKNNDEKLLAVAYQNLALNNYFCRNIVEAEKNIARFLRLFGKKTTSREAVIIKILQGVLAANKFNELKALDCYEGALDIAKESEYPDLVSWIYTNMGKVFLILNEFKTALIYLAKAQRIMNSKKTSFSNTMFFNYGYITLCHIELGNIRQASNTYRHTRQYYLANQNDEMLFMIKLIELKLAVNDGLNKKYDECISDIISLLNKQYLCIENFIDLQRVLEVTLKHQDKENSLKIVQAMEDLYSNIDIEDYKYLIIENKIACAMTFGDSKNAEKYCVEYHKYANMIRNKNKELILYSVKTRSTLDSIIRRTKKIEYEAITLREQAERDTLTGLLNRNAMNRLYSEAFQNAISTATPIGVSIIDIDYFKQYNDSLGHLQGDDCLVMVANEMRKLTSDTVYFIRYGGDEFFALYINKTNDEIMEIASTLKRNVEGLEIERKDGCGMDYITVTQGIYNSVPYPQDLPFEFTHTADNALYKGKMERGSIYFATDSND